MDALLAPYVYAVLAAAGAAAGFIDAIAGGGGLISFPALMWAGLPIPVALGTNKLQSSCGTTLAVIRFTRAGLIPWRTLRLAVIVTFLAATLGVIAVTHLERTLLQRIVPVLLLAVATTTTVATTAAASRSAASRNAASRSAPKSSAASRSARRAAAASQFAALLPRFAVVAVAASIA